MYRQYEVNKFNAFCFCPNAPQLATRTNVHAWTLLTGEYVDGPLHQQNCLFYRTFSYLISDLNPTHEVVRLVSKKW